MSKSFTITVQNVNQQCIFPNHCPICHHTIVLNDPLAINVIGNVVQALFYCPNDDCHTYFLVFYQLQSNNTMKIIALHPSKVQIEKFPEVIIKISPSFFIIYYQSEEARNLGLNHIAGPGYRKAFEFLIKDYAKYKSTEDKFKEIEQSFSGQVVDKFITDARIQNVAKRALWIGNDETHYLRSWADHDIEDLINLIKLTINWIDIENLSELYTKELPEKSKLAT